VTLPAFAAGRRAAVALAVQLSISPTRRAHSSKPTSRSCSGRMAQTNMANAMDPFVRLFV